LPQSEGFLPVLAPSRQSHPYKGAVDAQPSRFLLRASAAEDPADTADTALQRAKRGDLMAFRELLRIHKVRVFSMALRITGNSADAEEVAQDVFLKLHGALAQITTTSHLRHWLLRAVSHRCIDLLRKLGSRPRLVSMDALPEAALGAAMEAGGDLLAVAQVRRLVLELSPEARAVLLLRFQEELVPTEIATVLAMPLNTVKSHLRRSLDWLRAQLAGDSHGS
jgi:RNA polymerase sigma-70 factor (ECF subfamily)